MARLTKDQWDRRQLKVIAYHEAGHAVMAIEFGHAIRSVSIEPDADAGNLGCVTHPKRYRPTFRPDVCDLGDARFQTTFIREVLISLAGPSAEARFTRRWNAIGAGADMAYVEDLIDRVSGDGEDEPLLEWLKARARNLVAHRNNWVRIEGLARALLITPTMTGGEAREVCRLAFIASLPEDLRVLASDPL